MKRPTENNPKSKIQNPKSECPTAGALERFLSADADDAETEAIAAHLDVCERCRARLDADPAEAAWTEELRCAGRELAETDIGVNVPLAQLRAVLPEYEIIEEIGRGGMGIVYRARQMALNRTVALKILPALLRAVRPSAAARFRREAELAAALKHNNITAVHDFGEIDGTLYYAMELVEGRSLREVLNEIERTGAIDVVVGWTRSGAVQPTTKDERHGENHKSRRVAACPSAHTSKEVTSGESTIRNRTSVGNSKSSIEPTRLGSSSHTDKVYYRRVAEWMAEVADALHYAHSQGIIHRDVKPSNLLLADAGRLMISDFGLARAGSVETLTTTRSLLGTARYMSPEQADESAGAIDHRVDVYGLGATLYELLAFRPMFSATDDREVLDCVLNREPTPPHRFVRRVPRELETICLKAIEKNRNARYATAKALRDDLERWLLDLPIHAKRPSLLARVRKFARRRKVPVALGAITAVSLIVTGVLYGGYASSRRYAAETRAVAEAQGLELLVIETRSLLREGRHAAALAKIDAGLVQWNNPPQLLRLRAKTLGVMERDEEALQILEALLTRDPDDWETHYILATAYAGCSPPQQGNTAQLRLRKPWADMSQEEIDAKTNYHRMQVKRLMPNTAEACYVQACNESDPRRAIERLTQAIELDPDRYEFIFERADRHYLVEEYGAMLLDAERAVILRPGEALAHATRGRALLMLNRYEESIAAYNRAIELAPKQASHWHNRGVARLEIGQFKEAFADASQAIRLDPGYARPYGVRGHARAGLGNLDEGIQDCSRAIALYPTDAELYEHRLALCAEAERWEDVIDDASMMIQLHPMYYAGYEHRALGLLNVQQPERAIADCDRLVQLRPDYARGFCIRAIAHTRTGQFAKAIEDYRREIKIVPTASSDIYAKARLCLRIGDYSEAVSDLTRLIDLEPQSALALMSRGMAYELAGATELALADYRQAATHEGPTGAYARLWQDILQTACGREAASRGVVAVPSSLAETDAWTNHLFGLFAGTLSADELLAATATDDERAEAHYYIGCKALLDDDRDTACASFKQCLALNRDGILETAFAQARLRQLTQPPQNP